MEFFTIGVYNSTEEDFFKKLTANKIDTFCDVRQRRGVRGAKYAFVNSNRLQQRLNDLEIKYRYISGLSPTTEIRELQKAVDFEKGETKSERQELGRVFKTEYQNQILEKFDFENFFANLNQISADKIALFCVEEHPNACHRSLISTLLSNTYNYKITHL